MTVPQHRTLVALHAHPDDEALLTGGTLARAAAEGHRVVLVTATDGALGLAGADYLEGGLATRRSAELAASAAALGVRRVVELGYADSGEGGELSPDPDGQRRFVTVPVEEVATQVARLLAEEGADVLLGYDPAGGYGHRDHVHVHRVAARAAELAGIPVLEATLPRDVLATVVRWVGKVYRYPAEFDPSSWERAYTARRDITHRIDVRAQVPAKLAALAAHASQATGGDQPRTLQALLRLPTPVARLVLGHEWFRDPRLPAGTGRRSDVFEGI